MARLTPQKFTLESFASQSSWISPLLSALNSFLNDLVFASTNNFTINDNLYQEIKEVKFKNDSISVSNPLKFRTKFNVNPQGMLLIYIYDNTLSKYATQVPVVEWTFTDNQIVITSISGLTASTTYTIRFLVIYG